MLSSEQVEFYLEQGYLRISQMFTPEQMDDVPREARPEMSVGRIFRQVIGEIYQHQGHIAYLKGLARSGK